MSYFFKISLLLWSTIGCLLSIKSYSQQTKIDFFYPNINKIGYYQNYKEKHKITEYYRKKEWNLLYPLLFQYINQFGVENFNLNTDLITMMAEVALQRKDMATVKKMLRLVVKHYRGDVIELLKDYSEVSIPKENNDADLKYYYSTLLISTSQKDSSFEDKSIVHLDNYINTKYDDYGMTVGKGIDTLYFTSNRIDKKNAILMDIDNYFYEDIYISIRDENYEWSSPQVFEPTKTRYKEGSPFLSADNQSFYFSRCNSPDGFGNCDIYVVQRDSTQEWGQSQNLGPQVNSDEWDSHPSLSFTGDTLFFSSNRLGSFGGSDIYYSIKDSLGKWQRALNAGPIINSQYNEINPFFHNDYNVLYFSSNGQVFSIGDYDIYKSYLNNGRWLEPENLGRFINHSYADIYFTIDKQARWFFYAKPKNNNFQNHDIHCFSLPMRAKPHNLISFTGRVVEPSTGKVFQGTVTVIDLKDKIPITPKNLKSDGSFEFKLLDKREYLIVIDGDNFFRMEEVFFLDGKTSKVFKPQNIKQKITFQSIDFKTGSTQILPEMENNLHIVINHLKAHSSHHLVIVGHTDSDGDPDKNIQLSLDRANNIKEYILVYGEVSEDRVHTKGKGAMEPLINEEVTEAHKKLNRRVEFEILTHCSYH